MWKKLGLHLHHGQPINLIFLPVYSFNNNDSNINNRHSMLSDAAEAFNKVKCLQPTV